MPTELKPAARPAKSGREREVYGFCDHRRWLTRPVRNGSDHFGRRAGMEQTPSANVAPNGRCRTVRRLAIGAASKVFQPAALAGQEAAADQAVRISSDFADVIPLGGGRVALVLGDVCGKGQVAALYVSQALNALRLILSEHTPPARALDRVNRYLCNTELPVTCLSVALSLAVMDVGTGEVVCACAGSEPPLILRAGGSMEAVNTGSVSLGVEARRTFQAVDFLLGAGDALLMATDGVTEVGRANGSKSKDILCYEGMARLALDAFSAGGPPGRIARAVLDGAQAFSGGPLHDDASVLVAIQR